MNPYQTEAKCAGQAVTSPLRPIEGAMTELRENNQRLAHLVGLLHSRLEPVLGHASESACRSEGRLSACPMEGAIYSEAVSVSDAADRINDLLTRLQL